MLLSNKISLLVDLLGYLLQVFFMIVLSHFNKNVAIFFCRASWKKKKVYLTSFHVVTFFFLNHIKYFFNESPCFLHCSFCKFEKVFKSGVFSSSLHYKYKCFCKKFKKEIKVQVFFCYIGKW